MNRTSTHVSRMEARGRLITPRRNRFFHGKRMDAYHFELETAYGTTVRRMLNRMVLGGGVVCGLDVLPGDTACSVRITAGLAIDAWGREIVVPEDSQSLPIPRRVIDRVCGPAGNGGTEERPTNGSDQEYRSRTEEERPSTEGNETGRESEETPQDGCVTVTLCYHECETDPVEVVAGECGSGLPCAPGAIRELYRVAFEPGCQEPYDTSCRFPDVLRGGELDYEELARFITRECPDPPRNPCVPLANIRLACGEGKCEIDTSGIDITIRPVVFANAILFDMLSRIVEEERSGEGWRR